MGREPYYGGQVSCYVGGALWMALVRQVVHVERESEEPGSQPSPAMGCEFGWASPEVAAEAPLVMDVAFVEVLESASRHHHLGGMTQR